MDRQGTGDKKRAGKRVFPATFMSEKEILSDTYAISILEALFYILAGFGITGSFRGWTAEWWRTSIKERICIFQQTLCRFSDIFHIITHHPPVPINEDFDKSSVSYSPVGKNSWYLTHCHLFWGLLTSLGKFNKSGDQSKIFYVQKIINCINMEWYRLTPEHFFSFARRELLFLIDSKCIFISADT